MRRHIVQSFCGVNVVQALGHQMVECQLHVPSDVGVRIFIDAETGRCVLNKDVEQPNLV